MIVFWHMKHGFWLFSDTPKFQCTYFFWQQFIRGPSFFAIFLTHGKLSALCWLCAVAYSKKRVKILFFFVLILSSLTLTLKPTLTLNLGFLWALQKSRGRSGGSTPPFLPVSDQEKGRGSPPPLSCIPYPGTQFFDHWLPSKIFLSASRRHWNYLCAMPETVLLAIRIFSKLF